MQYFRMLPTRMAVLIMAAICTHSLEPSFTILPTVVESMSIMNSPSPEAAPLHPDETSPDQTYDETSPGEFPMCTDQNTEFPPFCLPQHEADMVVDATYYVTWNADFYPPDAQITIELRYSDAAKGDSAFTSAHTENSYGYLPLHMQQEWLQGKPQNALTLYIIEMEPTSRQRASARQGPTITLHPKVVEHHKPPPAIPINKSALYVGLPVSLGVVISVVAGLYFGMQESRRIGLGNIMGSRSPPTEPYPESQRELLPSDGGSVAKGNADDHESRRSEVAKSELYDAERRASHAFKRDSSTLKSWKV